MLAANKPIINNDATRLDAALAYAKMGFAVFPVHSKRANGSCTCNNDDCKSVGKHPRTANGLKDATKDPSMIRFWWNNAFQGSNVAVATGRISGFFAVDVDVKHDGLAAWENFKDDHLFDDYETPVQETPSGGKHIYYNMPAEGKVLTKTNVLANGIDIRGDGGYIVVTPSDGYSYLLEQGIGEIPLQNAPQSILDKVVKVITVSENDTPATIPTAGLYKLSKDEENKIKHALEYVEPDDHTLWWSIGAALHSTNGLDAFEWWCEWSQQSDKFDHNEHVAKWRDLDARRGNTETVIEIEYLYYEASKKGWVETFDHSDVDFDSFKMTNEEFQKIIQNNKPVNEVNAISEIFSARTISKHFKASEIPRRNWLIPNYLLAGYLNLLISAGAVGKSMMTLIEAISVASGKDLLGFGEIKQGNVLVINNEDDDDEINRRIAAICQYYGINTAELEDRLFIRSGYGARVLMAIELKNIVLESSNTKTIIDFCLDKKIVLLTVDPFVSTHESNENDNSHIDAVVQCYRKIAICTGVAIRLVHHTRKVGKENDGSAGNVEAARGASALKDAARVCHTLSLMGEQMAKDSGLSCKERHRLVRIDDAKTNFSLTSGEAKWFYKESVKIGNGEWLGVIRPYNLEVSDKPEKTTPESRKVMTIHDVAHAALNKLGSEGGTTKATELRAEYRLLVNCAKTKADDDFALMPEGSSKSERVNLNGNFYRIYQTREKKSRAPRYIHLQPDK